MTFMTPTWPARIGVKVCGQPMKSKVFAAENAAELANVQRVVITLGAEGLVLVDVTALCQNEETGEIAHAGNEALTFTRQFALPQHEVLHFEAVKVDAEQSAAAPAEGILP